MEKFGESNRRKLGTQQTTCAKNTANRWQWRPRRRWRIKIRREQPEKTGSRKDVREERGDLQVAVETAAQVENIWGTALLPKQVGSRNRWETGRFTRNTKVSVDQVD